MSKPKHNQRAIPTALPALERAKCQNQGREWNDLGRNNGSGCVGVYFLFGRSQNNSTTRGSYSMRTERGRSV